MYPSEVIAMMVVFASLTTTVCVLVSSTAWLINSVSRRYFEYCERELEVRRWEAESRVENARLSSGMPLWIDKDDPIEVASWHRAVAETWRVTARHAIANRPD